jgi:hypothetical protein
MQKWDSRFEEKIRTDTAYEVPTRKGQFWKTGVLPLARTPDRGCYLWNEKLPPLARKIATFGMKNCHLWREQNTTHTLQPSHFYLSDVLTV